MARKWSPGGSPALGEVVQFGPLDVNCIGRSGRQAMVFWNSASFTMSLLPAPGLALVKDGRACQNCGRRADVLRSLKPRISFCGLDDRFWDYGAAALKSKV
jgi:hypothetical protein